MMDDPLTRRTERIMKQSDEPNWRSRKWEKPIQEVESPSIVPKTEMSIKLENDDEQNQRSRLKELITQRLEAQSIALATEQENQRNQRSRLEEIIKRRIESQSIAQTQTPFIKEMESDEEDEESETEEDYKKRREFIHAYLTMDNEGEQADLKETETDEGIIGTPEEQKERLIHAYLTMEKDRSEQEEPNERRKLIHAYSKGTMDNAKEQPEQDKKNTHLRTSTEEEQKPSTWEEYDEEEPFEEYDEYESFKENVDEGKWTTQFSYPTEEEENALFLAFMTGNVEDQKTWINAKMNLTRTVTNEKIRRREEEILDRIIPIGIMDLDRAFEEEDEEETDDLSENRPYDLDMDQEEDFILKDTKIYPFSLPGREKSDEFINENTEEEVIQSLESLDISYQNHRRQDEETVDSLTTEPDGQLDKAGYFSELDVRWKYNDRHTEDENQWRINFETDKLSRDQKNEHQTTVNMGYVTQTKEQDTEYTRCVQRRLRDNDLFAEPEDCTSWMTGTKYIGLLNPENQLQTGLMKLDGIDIWPTPAMTTEVKSFLRFGNVDKGFIQDNWTLTEPLENLFEKDKIFLDKKNNQDDEDEIMSPVGSFSQLLDPECSNERTLENDDEQSDPIKSLSVHGLKTLRNHHFSKVTVATSVNDVIAVNVTNMDPRKRITMARIVNYMINSLSGKGPNIWEDIFEDWLIWTPQLPNKNTALANHSTKKFS